MSAADAYNREAGHAFAARAGSRVMGETGGLRLGASVAARERRLAALLDAQGRSSGDPWLREVVEDAQLLGSLQLAGVCVSWEEVRRSREGGDGPRPVTAWRRARAAVQAAAPLTVDALRAWHVALGGPPGFRRSVRERSGTPPSPPERIEEKLATLADWLAAEGARALRPEQAASLALARIVEILPFEDANGRVSRLAASHVMVRGGMRPPILVAGDGPRLLATLEAAFRLETGPLVELLVEASGRALDVMIQTLSQAGPDAGSV